MRSYVQRDISFQLGFTLVEMIIVIAVAGVLSSIATISYQNYIRKTQIAMVYQEVNRFRMPYQTLLNEGAGVRSFSPDGLSMPSTSKYCELSTKAPNINGTTLNAVTCKIQGLSYLQNQTLNLDRASDGSWQCHSSAGIPSAYLPQACQ